MYTLGGAAVEIGSSHFAKGFFYIKGLKSRVDIFAAANKW